MDSHEPLTISLQALVVPIAPQDPMAEAGRKALLSDFITMLEHEAGSRSGEDLEDLHDMRVSTRRMRSTLRMLSAYYKPKAIDSILNDLHTLAAALGEVRDLDVMIANLTTFQQTLPQPVHEPVEAAPEDQAENAQADASVEPTHDPLQPVLDHLNTQRAKARKNLIRLLDKGGYRRFVQEFSAFLTKPGKGALPVDLDDVHPFQVRHLLPELIFEHLAAVRAYDAALADATVPMLHALRIEFKRLRYAVSIFGDVLGTGINEFTNELKTIQDHLGKIADIRTAKARLKDITDDLDPRDDAEALAALHQYVAQLDDEQQTLRDSFDEVWKHFNTKTVQRQLSNAVAGL